jgi:nitrogen fixation/metabolism regulation signal transduction histidine kinase
MRRGLWASAGTHFTAGSKNTTSLMKLKVQFILYLIVLHGFIAIFAYDDFVEQKYWFLAVEAALVVSLVLAFRIYRRLIRPLDLIASGVQSINDRDFSVNFRKTGSRELDELIEVFNRMMEQLRTERKIQQEQHYFLQKLMEASPVGIIILDGNDKIRQVNPAASKILDCQSETLTGLRLEEIRSPLAPWLCRFQEQSAQTIRINGMNSYRMIRGEFMNLGYRNTFLLVDEITGEVMAAEKEAFGKVIRMMSHEVNNSIGATNSILQTLKTFEHFGCDDPGSKTGKAIDVIIERNANLNRFMNNLADVIRLPAPVLEKTDLVPMLHKTLHLMEPFCMQHAVRLEIRIPCHPLVLPLDAIQIEQLLVNVIRNAVESIGRDGEIKIILDPQKRELIIEDTGNGIAPEVQDQLFTPFFSSKKHGQGIGLTLSREIAHRHGFGISLENRSGGGAVFRLTVR